MTSCRTNKKQKSWKLWVALIQSHPRKFGSQIFKNAYYSRNVLSTLIALACHINFSCTIRKWCWVIANAGFNEGKFFARENFIEASKFMVICFLAQFRLVCNQIITLTRFIHYCGVVNQIWYVGGICGPEEAEIYSESSSKLNDLKDSADSDTYAI